MGRLDGRVVLVTGAARGIGRGICLAAAEAGADVAVSDVELAGARETARACEEEGVRSLALPLDVTDERSIEAAFEGAEAGLGPVHGLAANAGVVSMAPALEIPDREWDRHFGVNVRGLFDCCRIAARRIIARAGEGSIVAVASNAGKVGYPNMAAYNASKAAVINLARNLAVEWAPHGIVVNAVCPGGVDTEMLDGVARWVAQRIGADPEELRAGMKPRLMDRHIRPLEVGRVVAFLLSDEARIIRGQAINTDGGDTPY